MLGPLIVDIQGTLLTQEDRELLSHPLVGGVILFTRNYESVQQLKNLTTSIRALRSPHLLITVDHEGGVVQRFREGLTRLPAMVSFGESYNEDPQAAQAEAKQWGYTMASELKAIGVDLSFAPVLDLATADNRALQGGRAISVDPNIVIAIAKAYIDGMHQAQMSAVAKHFPGHGAIVADTHEELAQDPRSLEAIAQRDLLPFVALSQIVQGIMPAHIVFSQIDALPASLSKIWLQTILRQQLQFKGVVFSDCLSMQGAAQCIADPVQRVATALQAGCDLVLICNNSTLQRQVLQYLDISLKLASLNTKIENIRHYKES